MRNRIYWRMGSSIGFFVLWEIYGRGVDPLLFSYPSIISKAAWELIINGQLIFQLSKSLQSFLIGMSIALVVGIVLGLVVGRYRIADLTLRHIFDAFYVTPQVALIPLIIMWFGLGLKAKIFIVFLVSFFPIFYNTADGVRNLSRQFVEVAKAYGARESQIFREVTLPSTLPFIMTGVRLGVGRALTGMVVAEMFTAITGLGAMVVYYSNTLDTARMFVPVFTLATLGVAFLQLGNYLEARFAPWRVGERAWE